MTDLHAAVDDFLALRRALGYKLRRHDALLHDFVGSLAESGATKVTTELAVAWAAAPAGASPVWWGQRLGVVRGFARYLHALDPATEVPPTGLLPVGKWRAVPYLFSDADVVALMEAARTLRRPLLAAGYETLIGLLAVTGMRLGEAIGLDRDDLDRRNALVRIRETKYRKSREVPLHPSTLAALEAYARVRDELCPGPKGASFFVSSVGTRLIHVTVQQTFSRLARQAGLVPRSVRCRPRPHSLRHSFATRTVLGWYQNGEDVEANLPRLSTVLGHVDPTTTYWYLSAVPELMAAAAERVERDRAESS